MNKTAQNTAPGQATAPSALHSMVQDIKIPSRSQMSFEELCIAFEAMSKEGQFRAFADIYALGYARAAGNNKNLHTTQDKRPLMFETPIPDEYSMSLDEIASFFETQGGGLYWNCLALYRMAFMGGYSYGYTKATAPELLPQ